MIELRSDSNADAKVLGQLESCWHQVVARPDVGFTHLPTLKLSWDALDNRIRNSRPAQNIIVIGIGGSSLGTQVIYEALRARCSARVTFLESPDPDIWQLHRGFAGPEWRDKHFVIVSKSGSTLETLAWVEQLNASNPEWLKQSQVTVVCSVGNGPLQKWAEHEKIPTLFIPENVGGRFSVLSAAGMLPAGLMGLNLSEFRVGASWALANTSLMHQLSAQCLSSFARSEWITQMWTYSESLRVMGEWWQQLWSESLGKKNARGGGAAVRVSSPMSCRGPRDQHSQAQQLIDVPGDKYVLVNRVKSVESAGEAFVPALFPEMPIAGRRMALGKILAAEAEAFERSLTERGVAFSTLTLNEISERSLGAYFMLWQMVVAQLGEYLDINAYDQPGVEVGKKYAAEILLR